MGRIGDGDVHAAYVEFRAKDSDKVSPPSLLHERIPVIYRTYPTPLSRSIVFKLPLTQ